VQVFVEPFGKPWLLLSDFSESQYILLRKREIDQSSFISNTMGPLRFFEACFKTNNNWRMSREWAKDLMTPSFLEIYAGPGINKSVQNLLKLWKEKAHLASGRHLKPLKS
jgi:hypothetical protein